jgi:hypothetical protein
MNNIGRTIGRMALCATMLMTSTGAAWAIDLGGNANANAAANAAANQSQGQSQGQQQGQQQGQGQIQSQGQQQGNVGVNVQGQGQNNKQNIAPAQSTSVTIEGDQRNTPAAIAPAMAVSPATCMASVVGGGSGPMFGISLGFPMRDHNCERIVNARQLYAFGTEFKMAAIALLCQNDGVGEAMLAAGLTCPGYTPKAKAAKGTVSLLGGPEPVTTQNTTNFGERR